MIPLASDITAKDRLRTDQLVEFYLGSYDNITEDNAQALIDLFSDSGNFTVKFPFLSSLSGLTIAYSTALYQMEIDFKFERFLLRKLSFHQRTRV